MPPSPKALLEKTTQYWTEVQPFLISKAVQILVAVVFFLVAHFFASRLRAYMMRVGRRERQKDLAPPIVAPAAKGQSSVLLAYVTLGQVLYWVVIVAAAITVFKVLGIETSSMLALLGTIGFALGLALQGALSDVAAGMMLAIFRAYDIDDVVEVQGQVGYVRSFNLFNTLLEDAPSGALITIPNRNILSSVFTNVTKENVSGVVFDILVSNDNKDFANIIETLREEIQQMPGVLASPSVAVGVLSMREAGTVLRVQAYVRPAEVIAQRGALPTQTRILLEREGVKMAGPVAIQIVGGGGAPAAFRSM